MPLGRSTAPKGNRFIKSKVNEKLAPRLLYSICEIYCPAIYALALPACRVAHATELAGAGPGRNQSRPHRSPSNTPKSWPAQMAGHHGAEGDRAVTEAIRFLEKARPLPPLAASNGMSSSALTHVQLDMGPIGGRGHKGSEWQPALGSAWRSLASGSGTLVRTSDYGVHDARAVVIRLVVDDGVSGRGHRKNIFSRDFHVCWRGQRLPRDLRGSMCKVIDFADGVHRGAGPGGHALGSANRRALSFTRRARWPKDFPSQPPRGSCSIGARCPPRPPARNPPQPAK